jgi:hypothetical protein
MAEFVYELLWLMVVLQLYLKVLSPTLWFNLLGRAFQDCLASAYGLDASRTADLAGRITSKTETVAYVPSSTEIGTVIEAVCVFNIFFPPGGTN